MSTSEINLFTQGQDATAPTAADEPKVANGHKIVVIDGHNLAFRSYYAVQSLSTSKGQSVNAVFGFMRSLLKLLKQEGEHDATVVTFDAHAKTFRHEQFEGYKAQRSAIPEDLPEQLYMIKELVELMGLHHLEVPGLEADDLFGTIATQCAKQGYHVEIISTDRDAFQLISDRVTVLNPVKNLRYDAERVLSEYGVRVEQWIDYRALTGDSSDNIPGAKGIGPKTASKLLQRYSNLQEILTEAQAGTLQPENAGKKIAACYDDVLFSKELSVILTDADITIDPQNWAQREPNQAALVSTLTALEFGSILKELTLPTMPQTPEGPTEAALTAKLWSELLQDDLANTVLSVKLSSDDPLQASLVEAACVLPNTSLSHTSSEGELLELLKQHPYVRACDAKRLCVWAMQHGVTCEAIDDPLLLAYILDPNVTDPEILARKFAASEWGETAQQHAAVSAQLLAVLPKQLTQEQMQLYKALELPLSNILAVMEARGITLDRAVFTELSEALQKEITGLEHAIRTTADNPLLNVNSRDQLAELLFDTLKLQAGKKTSTGKRSTAVSVLEGLRDKHPVVGEILTYRELSKLKNTYLDPLPKLVNPHTRRLHTTFSQTTAVTGRLSSINPNLQNIPIRTELGRQIRRGFVAAEDFTLLAADYSQIELRVLAHMADEPKLIDAFAHGEDIHARTAAQVFDIDIEHVDSDKRRIAKTINFGVLYGMGAHRLSRDLDIEYKEADQFISGYFAGYPKIKQYIDSTLEQARTTGYVETLLGRRRYIADIHSKNRNAREYAERTAYNMPIQGTAADIMKLAMVTLAPKLTPLGAAMLLQVHDELVIETPKAQAADTAELVRTTMQNAFSLHVPLVVEVGKGYDWLVAK